MGEQDRLRSLQQIHDFAQSMKTFVVRNNNVSPHINTPKARRKFHITPLRFPSIENIIKSLLDSGLSEHVLQRSSSTVVEAVVSLQETHSRCYEQTALRLLDLPLDSTSTLLTEMLERLKITYESLFTKQYLPAISMKLKAVNDAYLHSSNHRRSDEKKLPFNNEYTPLLEKYFEYNAYPSAPDRKVLAQKSLMTQRQIEVWFQNHRNRAKKEGMPLRRYQHNNISENTSIFSLCDNMSTSEILDFEGGRGGELLEKNFTLESSETVAVTADGPAPFYTFPTPYKSRYPQNPLIMQSQDIKKLFKFSSPPWSRKPVTRLAPVPVMEVDDLASAFTCKLNLRRRMSKEQSRQNSPVDTNNKDSWFAHRVTTPSPAPHPALVKPKQIQSFIQPTLSTLSGWLVDLAPKPVKYSIQPVELPEKTPDSRRKKQRYKCKASLGGLGRRSGYPTSTVIPGSRTSSCSSIASTDSLVSSSSSSTSSLSTPSTSPTPSPIPLTEANFFLQDQLLDELFGHYPQELTLLEHEPGYKNYSLHNPLKIPSLIAV